MTDSPSASGPAPESERNFNRLKKVVHAPDWKGGKPVSHEKAVSQAIKYVRLESCEDTLDGLVATLPAGDLLAANTAALVEDYRLRSALGEETAGSPCLLGRDFRDPFAYTLSVVRDGERRETPADLPETSTCCPASASSPAAALTACSPSPARTPKGKAASSSGATWTKWTTRRLTVGSPPTARTSRKRSTSSTPMATTR